MVSGLFETEEEGLPGLHHWLLQGVRCRHRAVV